MFFSFQTLPSESVPDLVRMRGDEDGRTENSVVVNWDRPLEVPGECLGRSSVASGLVVVA